MSKYYSGRFVPINISKYAGDWRSIKYRSLWERQCFRFLDENPSIISWSSETVIVPYICATDNRAHRYFVDLKVKFRNGDIHLIEIKPKAQTIKPKAKRMSKRYLTEVLTWAKNSSKWDAARLYCSRRGWIFSIWTEDVLRALGVKILISEIVKTPKNGKKS